MSIISLHPRNRDMSTPMGILGASSVYAWLRSDTASTAGSSPVYVDTWTDKSGNSRPWSRDRGYPEYKSTGAPSGKPTVCVGPTGPDGFGVSWSIPEPGTLIFAGKWDWDSAVPSVLFDGAGSGDLVRNGAWNGSAYDSPVLVLNGSMLTNYVWGDNEWHICEISVTGGSDSRITIDNTTTTTGSLSGTIDVSYVPRNSGQEALFEFTEVLAVSRTLTTSERAAIFSIMNKHMNG